MATIIEDYVSFETAKLLKEKGFNEPCIGFYKYDNTFHDFYEELPSSSNTELEGYWEGMSIKCISAPTLQMAMKWLREVHNLFIDTYYDCDFSEGYKFSVHKLPKGTTLESHNENYSTYEEAAEAAIEYCLENLI